MKIFFIPLILIPISSLFVTGDSEISQPEQTITEKKFNAKVYLNISADDELKNQIYSYLSRELRSLGDVTLVVEDEPDWIIHIIAMKSTNTSGIDMGVVFSTVIESRYKITDVIKLIIDNKVEKEGWKETRPDVDWKKAIDIIIPTVTYIADHMLRVCGPESIKISCQEIVADFDSGYLKNKREEHQKMHKEN